MSVPTLAVVGTGAVARAVARRHADAGGAVVAIVSRDRRRAAALGGRLGMPGVGVELADCRDADAVLVAVADAAVPLVGRQLAVLAGAERTVWLHTSGALAGSDLLAGAAFVGSLHPLRAFPAATAGRGDDDEDRRLAALVSGTHWFHEGGGAREAEGLVCAWAGTLHALAPGGKALYHAGAAVLSNHTVALFDAATRLFAAAGVSPAASREPLSVLLAGTAANLAALGAEAALTGPVARGDADTVARHLAALGRADPGGVAAYRALAAATLELACRKGSLDAAAAARLRALLADA